MISLNKNTLKSVNQEFINKNINSNTSKLLLQKQQLENVSIQELVIQIEAKKRCQKKLSTWFQTKNIYYPNKLNIEQTSSEITAEFKTSLIEGKQLIDLTGGFGVDDYYFSKRFDHVVHCEINGGLSEIVKHNYQQLKVSNISCYPKDGITVLDELNQSFDWIYLDPSRRSDIKGKVFLLNDCLPNAPKHLDTFFKHTKNVMIKTSPLLDITSGINELKHVKTIYCVALNNEVKELLWILERDFNGPVEMKTVNLKNEQQEAFNFNLIEESQEEANYSIPLAYLYEPNSAVLKSGAFNSVSTQLNIAKLHKHSHLYTSKDLITFPGRRFKIIEQVAYNKKMFKKVFKTNKANVTTRNFSEKVDAIRKKLGLKDGGNDYLFFTTDLNEQKIVLICEKA